jgi:oligopeptidase B
MKSQTPTPPLAEKRPVSETWHGHLKVDDYKWLKAENWQQVMHTPSLLPLDIRAYLDAENAYTKAIMADSEALQARLFDELKGRIKEDDESVPVPDGPFDYSTAFVTGGQYPLLKRQRKVGGAEEVLLNCNQLAEGKAFFHLGDATRSPDHRKGAWSVDENGSEYYTLRVRDFATGSDLADELVNTGGGACWSADGQHIFYTLQDENHRPLKTLRHRLGTPQIADVLVHDEKDTGMFTGLGATQSERFIIISVHDHDTSECWLIDAEKPEEHPRLVSPRVKGLEYEMEHWNDHFIIKTNADGADDYKLVTAPLEDPSPANWVDLVAHRPGIFLAAFAVFKDWLVRMERENALPRIVVRNMSSGEEHVIAFTEEAYALGLGDMREYDTETLRFSYSSPTTPSQVFDYNMRTRERSARCRKCRQAMILRFTWRGGFWRRPMTASRFPSPCSIAATRNSTVRPRSGSMATAPTAFRCLRVSTPTYCHW